MNSIFIFILVMYMAEGALSYLPATFWQHFVLPVFFQQTFACRVFSTGWKRYVGYALKAKIRTHSPNLPASQMKLVEVSPTSTSIAVYPLHAG
jgi:hypothetical protein